ncbi:serine/threonine-protein kinase DCLK1-like isoform X2 [Hetaerina americana]|uniref:serine/threonine-protein kinase DCLK1-like isoform X2 n=1 Tax=Hetaerina americana TaxID=62018 RepID=UPI003A7F3DB6
MSKPTAGITSAMSGRGAVASVPHPPSIHPASVGHSREKASVVDGRSSLQRSVNAKLGGVSNLPQPLNSTVNSRFSISHNQAGSRRDNYSTSNNTNTSLRLGARNSGTGPSTQASSRHTQSNTGRVSIENNRPRESLGGVNVNNSSLKVSALNANSHAALRVSPTTNSAPFHNDESSSSPSVLPVQNISLSVGHAAKSGIPSPTGSTRMGLHPIVNSLKPRDSGNAQNVPISETNGVCKPSERDALEDTSSKIVPSTNGASRLGASHPMPSTRTAVPNGPTSRLGGPASLANSSRSLGAPAVNVKSIGNKASQGPTSPRGGNQRVASKHVPAAVNSPSSSWSIWSKVSSSTSQPLQNGHHSSPNGVIVRPRVVTVIRNGSSRPRKVVRLLLNRRTAPCFNSALSALTLAIKLDSGAVRKVFTLDGTPVTCLEDFFREDDIFVAYGSERYSRDDFDLDLEELKAVRQQAKSSASLRRLAPLRPSSPGRIRRDADGFISRECTGSSLGGGGGVSRRTSSQARPGMPPKTKPQRRRGATGSTSKVMPVGPVLGRPRLPSTGASGARVPVGSRNGVAEGVEFVEISSLEVGSQSGGDISPGGIEGIVQDVDEEESAMEIPEEVSQQYDVGRIIGDGNFAVVRECTKRDSGTKYALKVIDRSKCRGREHMVESEVAVLRRVSHPNIVGLHAEFHSPTELYLVLELVKGGDLFDAIASLSKFSEDVASHMIRDLASALCYLHSLHIVHRDIKPENLLVVEEGGAAEGERLSLKLGDFGLAQVVTEPLFTVCGTPTYVAPEILAETGYGLKVDIWAAGVIAYILLCGFPPFVSSNNNQEELFDRILRGHFSFPTSHWEHVSPSARDLVSHMLRVDPELRFSAEDVLDHPWVPLADGDMGNGYGGGGPESDIRARVYEELGMRFDGGQMVDIDQQNSHEETQSQDNDDEDGDEDDEDDEDDAKLLSSTESQQCYHALEVV